VTRSRGIAVAAALIAALAAAGCGLGPGPEVGSVELTVTREYGRVPVLQRDLRARESDTVMRLLEGSAKVDTRYGGGFVKSIDGVAEGQRGGRPYDWFYYVDGVEASIGAAEYPLRGQERVWWDYHDWSQTNHIPAVVGSWPAPFVGGYGGRKRPVALECEGGGEACGTARSALEAEGVELAPGNPDDAIRVLVGPWARLRSNPAARLIGRGPRQSGVFAEFASRGGGYELVALDQDGGEAASLGPRAGLVAATSSFGGPPVWVLTGGTGAGVRAAAEALDPEKLRDHFAVAVEGDEVTALPVEPR
jgi:hypothetical protein